MVVEVSFPQSIGISLVDGVPQEITYIQLDSSGAIWERRLKHRNRFKYLPNKISEELEEAYNAGIYKYITEVYMLLFYLPKCAIIILLSNPNV